MCTLSTANTLCEEYISTNENTLQFNKTRTSKNVNLSPAPQYASGANVSIIGLLGGAVNRKQEELVGRVLQQRKIFRNPIEAAVANARATRIATHITLKKEILGGELIIYNPKYLTASFSHQQKSRFRQSVNWMLKSKVELLVTLDDWMEELLTTHSSVAYQLPQRSLSAFAGVKIWMMKKRIDKPVKDSLNEQYLLHHFSEQH